MSVNTSEQLECCFTDASSIEETVTQLVEIVTEQQQRLEEQADRIEQLETELAETRQQAAKDRQRISDLEEHGSDDADPTPEAAQTDSPTPIERLSDGDHDTVAQHVTPSIQRAVTLFENLPEWGSKTPQGYTLRPADNPKQLLEAATGESLAWQQYYRAAEALEQLSRGAVTFFDHNRHGKTLVLHEHSSVHDRLTDTTAGRSQSSLAAD